MLAAASGCGSDDDDQRNGSSTGGTGNGSGGAAAGGGTGGSAGASGGTGGGAGSESGAVYAMMVQVYSLDGENRDVYAVLSDTLDVTSVSLDRAREFGGVANFAAVGGRLLVSSGEEPRIDSYTITPELDWQAGESISFASFGLAADGANIFSQWFVDERTAYLPFDVTSRVLWDPSAMTITTALEDTSLALDRDGLMLEVGGNRSSLRYDGPVMQPFFYHDEDWLVFAPSSPIAVYDPVTHAESAVIDAPCPGLAVATQDEAGNTYFSAWDYSPGPALYGVAPAPCAARVRPDRTLDEAWTTDMTQWTAGRMSLNFRYVADGKGVAEVLHHENMARDFTAPYDPTVEDEVWSGGHWRLWFFDLEAGEGREIAGIEPGSAGVQLVRVDGRTFLFVAYDDSARTVAYELDGDGNLVERFRSTGEIFKWIRVR